LLYQFFFPYFFFWLFGFLAFWLFGFLAFLHKDTKYTSRRRQFVCQSLNTLCVQTTVSTTKQQQQKQAVILVFF
jgi:hypothetical protein